MTSKRFKHDGLTLKQMVNSLPAIAENRTRLMIYFRQVANYAIQLEEQMLAEAEQPQKNESVDGEGGQ